MDIQAYFEEWSRQPGDVVRLAISTPHQAVRASLVRLVSGPGQTDTVEGRVVDLSSVLDRTVPGRLQSTIIGSYAVLPLPAPIKDGAISIHCWAWPTVPERETPQTIWSLGDMALVIGSGAVSLRVKDQTLASITGAIVARHWYSLLVTLGNGEASIELKRLDGKVGAHRIIAVATGATVTSDTLMLATSGLGPAGSPLQPLPDGSTISNSRCRMRWPAASTRSGSRPATAATISRCSSEPGLAPALRCCSWCQPIPISLTPTITWLRWIFRR